MMGGGWQRWGQEARGGCYKGQVPGDLEQDAGPGSEVHIYPAPAPPEPKESPSSLYLAVDFIALNTANRSECWGLKGTVTHFVLGKSCVMC